MKAIVQQQFGGPEVLRYQECPTPEPAVGQVLIRVAAAGVHVLDTIIRQGDASFGPPNLPMIPGREVAGTIVGVGLDAGVTTELLGRRVVCHLGAGNSGGYAQFAVAATERLHFLPDGMDYASAIALIGSGRTALAILDEAAVGVGDVVAIPGAAGGLGNLLVQCALAAGAKVIALVYGAEKALALQPFSAQIVDISQADWLVTLPMVPTVLLDGIGGKLARDLMNSLAPLGRIIEFGWSSGEPLTFDSKDLMARSLTVSAGIGPKIMSRPGYLRELEGRALAGWDSSSVRPVLHKFELARASDAHRAIETRRAIGKVVLTN